MFVGGQDRTSFDELQEVPSLQITQLVYQEHWGLSLMRF